MNDPRVALRAVLGEWVRLRAATRAHAMKLAAAEYALTRDARTRNADTCDADEQLALSAHVAAQRAELEALGRELDDRIAGVAGECAALDVDYRALLVDAAALRRSGADAPLTPDSRTASERARRG